jgi:hypothetical protein
VQLHGVTVAGAGQSLDLHSSIRHNSTHGVTRQLQHNAIGAV